MKIKEIFDLAIELGIKNDLRGEKKVKSHLKRMDKKYKGLKKDEKLFFDQELLSNPYPDSRILHDNNKDIKKILVGIDIEGPELLLAKQMDDIDLVIAHHPTGRGLSALFAVMELQAEVLADYGVPINIAQGLLSPRISEVARGVNPINHYRAYDMARLLDIGYINVHTPCDNMVAMYVKKAIEKKNCEYVSDVIEVLNKIPEYDKARMQGIGPTLFAGKPENFCGKVAITEMTGGTEGTPDIYEKLAAAGIGTVVGMHMSDKHKKAAEKAHINALIAGHISSDSIGVNLFLDELEKKGVQIVPCSGLIRIKR